MRRDQARGYALTSAGLVAAVFALYFLAFDGPAAGYWDTYVTAPAMFLANRPIDFLDEEGRPLYDIHLPGRLPQNLVDRGSYGIITKDQRLGMGLTFAPAFQFLGLSGFRVLHAMCAALSAALMILVGRAWLGGRAAAVAAAALLMLNPFALSVNRLNPNPLGQMGLLAILALMAAEGGRARWLVIGLIYGALGGFRMEAIFMAPAILFWLWTEGEARTLRAKVGPSAGRFAALLAGSLAGFAPCLYWNHYAFGQILIHPSQYAHFEGFRPTFEHSLLGLKFAFNGLLNWPLHDRVVRTPHFAFPTFLTLPLTVVGSFGLILATAGPWGCRALWSRDRRIAVTVALWIVPFALLMAVQENWEELKSTFFLLIYAPLALLSIAGAADLLRGRHALRIVSWVAAAGGLALLVHLTARLEFPADERWYVRFPQAAANRGEGAGLGLADRREWIFFHRAESPAEYDEQKREMTRVNLLPLGPLPYTLRPAAALRRFADEIGVKSLSVLDIWKYIYGG